LEGTTLAGIKSIVHDERDVVAYIVDHFETGVVLTISGIGLEHAPAV